MSMHLKPMTPEEESGLRAHGLPVGTAEMKNGDCYYIPSPVIRDGYVKEVWSNHSFDFEVCDKGLVHLNSEAASAHTKAFIALSKKKD